MISVCARVHACTDTQVHVEEFKDKTNTDLTQGAPLLNLCGSVLYPRWFFVPSPLCRVRGGHQVVSPVSADPVSSEEFTGFKSIHSLLEEEEEEEEPPRILLYHGKGAALERAVGEGPLGKIILLFGAGGVFVFRLGLTGDL